MANKKNEVIDKSLNLFMKYGFRKTTMVDIAQSMGVSRPTLYALYPDKESILKEIVSNRIATYREEFTEQLSKAKSFKERLFIPFDIWIIKPYADSKKDSADFSLIREATELAPDAMKLLWDSFEEALCPLIDSEAKKKSDAVSSETLTQICVASCRDAKNEGVSLKKIESLVEGLIDVILKCRLG